MPEPSTSPVNKRSRRILLSALAFGAIALAGVLLVLYAWKLPPFRSTQQASENAKVAGQVTIISPQLSGYVVEVLVQDFQAARGQFGAGLLQPLGRNAVVDAQQEIALAHRLEVLHQHLHHVAAQLRTDDGHLPAYQRVLGALQRGAERRQLPGIEHDQHAGQGDGGEGERAQQDAARACVGGLGRWFGHVSLGQSVTGSGGGGAPGGGAAGTGFGAGK